MPTWLSSSLSAQLLSWPRCLNSTGHNVQSVDYKNNQVFPLLLIKKYISLIFSKHTSRFLPSQTKDTQSRTNRPKRWSFMSQGHRNEDERRVVTAVSEI